LQFSLQADSPETVGILTRGVGVKFGRRFCTKGHVLKKRITRIQCKLQLKIATDFGTSLNTNVTASISFVLPDKDFRILSTILFTAKAPCEEVNNIHMRRDNDGMYQRGKL